MRGPGIAGASLAQAPCRSRIHLKSARPRKRPAAVPKNPAAILPGVIIDPASPEQMPPTTAAPSLVA